MKSLIPTLIIWDTIHQSCYSIDTKLKWKFQSSRTLSLKYKIKIWLLNKPTEENSIVERFIIRDQPSIMLEHLTSFLYANFSMLRYAKHIGRWLRIHFLFNQLFFSNHLFKLFTFHDFDYVNRIDTSSKIIECWNNFENVINVGLTMAIGSTTKNSHKIQNFS